MMALAVEPHAPASITLLNMQCNVEELEDIALRHSITVYWSDMK